MLKYILLIIILLPKDLLSQNILVKNGTLLTVTNGVKENTDILIINGKIAKIDKNLTAPEGTRIVDANNQYVMPGIIDAHSHIALDVINEATSPVTAEVNV